MRQLGCAQVLLIARGGMTLRNGGLVTTVAMGIRLCLSRTNLLPQNFPQAHCVWGCFG